MLQNVSYSIEEIDKGVVLVFDAPGNSIPLSEQYFYYFDIVSVLPATPAPTITFDPPTASYSMLANRNFSPKIAIKVKSVHTSELKILCRLTIKDKYATTLYISYLSITAIPKSIFSFNCTLLNTNVPGNVGPDGGSVLVLNESSSASLSQISQGMEVTGPGIPTNKKVYVKNVLFDSANRIELTELIPLTNDQPRTGIFTFILQTKCVNPETINARETIPTYTILSKDNNWEYIYNDKTIIKFYREDTNDDSIVVFLPSKNPDLLPNNEEPSQIPQGVLVNIGGRVIGDSVCVTSLIFD